VYSISLWLSIQPLSNTLKHSQTLSNTLKHSQTLTSFSAIQLYLSDSIYDIAVYDTLPSPSQIEILFNKPISSPPATLVPVNVTVDADVPSTLNLSLALQYDHLRPNYPAVVKPSVELLPPLALHWPSIGPTLALHWPYIGPPLALHWPSIGPTLATFPPRTWCYEKNPNEYGEKLPEPHLFHFCD